MSRFLRKVFSCVVLWNSPWCSLMVLFVTPRAAKLMKTSDPFVSKLMRTLLKSTMDGWYSKFSMQVIKSNVLYYIVLSEYTKWFLQLVSRACPWRKDLITSLALGQPDMESVVLEQMEQVLVNLKKDVAIINKLYTTYNLDSDAKV